MHLLSHLAVLTVASFAIFQVASACSDDYPPGYCNYYKSIGSCSLITVRQLCKKTCGDCGGGVLPTLPPNPITKRTMKPYPTQKPPTGAPLPGKCGMPMSSSSLVIAGELASPGAWPWQIRLLINRRAGCGGTLISREWVVTAAHCVSRNLNPGLYTVQVGATNVNNNEPHREIYSVSQVVMHSQYEPKKINRDIALLKLSKSVQFNQHVQPACLPEAGEELAVGTQCYITGFGKTSHPGAGSKVLMQALLPVVSQSTCTQLNTATSTIRITDYMICAGHGPSRRQSGCHGDSGGPFVCKNDRGGFTLYGAVSWGSGTCDSKKSYTVFSKVSKFRDWIKKYVRI